MFCYLLLLQLALTYPMVGFGVGSGTGNEDPFRMQLIYLHLWLQGPPSKLLMQRQLSLLYSS